MSPVCTLKGAITLGNYFCCRGLTVCQDFIFYISLQLIAISEQFEIQIQLSPTDILKCNKKNTHQAELHAGSQKDPMKAA
jgi:hypothetical protein